jgi:hypothetical protein
MAFRKFLQRLNTPVSELDSDRLREFCAAQADVIAIGELAPRQLGTVVGEISSIRIVPRAGSPSLEATITDGTGSIVAVWTGRRRIAGVSPGKRLVLEGRGMPAGSGTRLLVYNPRYELL